MFLAAEQYKMLLQKSKFVCRGGILATRNKSTRAARMPPENKKFFMRVERMPPLQIYFCTYHFTFFKNPYALLSVFLSFSNFSMRMALW